MAKEWEEATISTGTEGISSHRQRFGHLSGHSSVAGIHPFGAGIWQVFTPPSPKIIQLRLPIQDTDVLYLRLLTKDVVVLSSTEAITDLTEKRSSIYSDRVSSLVKLTCKLTLTDAMRDQPHVPMLEL